MQDDRQEVRRELATFSFFALRRRLPAMILRVSKTQDGCERDDGKRGDGGTTKEELRGCITLGTKGQSRDSVLSLKPANAKMIAAAAAKTFSFPA